MALDFTYSSYERLLDAALASGYQFLTVREYVSAEDLPDRFLLMRHDVDRKPENALDMARIEAEAGVPSTYYFRAIEKTYDPALISSVEDLGHEVGYHYEDVDTADGDVYVARESFRENLARFRSFVDVDTVAMHGNPLTSHDNRDLWEHERLEEHDLLGEVYLSVDFTDVVYFSDSNRTWYDEKTIVDDWPVGPSEKPTQVTSTPELIELVESGALPRLYVLVHPNRWADSTVEWVQEFAKDAVINTGKWGLYQVRSLRERRSTPGI